MRILKAGGNSGSEWMTDINLTGPIAANLVENLKPTIWSSAILFGVITAIITSAITFLSIKITNEAAEKREERNRIAEARRMQREERKNVYVNFIYHKIRIDYFVKSQDPTSLDVEEYITEFYKCLAELTLLCPEVFQQMANIIDRHPYEGEGFLKEWPNISADLKNEIIPLMQAELKMV